MHWNNEEVEIMETHQTAEQLLLCGHEYGPAAIEAAEPADKPDDEQFPPQQAPNPEHEPCLPGV